MLMPVLHLCRRPDAREDGTAAQQAGQRHGQRVPCVHGCCAGCCRLHLFAWPLLQGVPLSVPHLSSTPAAIPAQCLLVLTMGICCLSPRDPQSAAGHRQYACPLLLDQAPSADQLSAAGLHDQ